MNYKTIKQMFENLTQRFIAVYVTLLMGLSVLYRATCLHFIGILQQYRKVYNRTCNTIREKINEFRNPRFARTYATEVGTYASLFFLFGVVIAITRYNELAIESLEAMVSSRIATIIRLFSVLILVPLSVLIVIPVRNLINVNKLQNPAIVAAIILNVFAQLVSIVGNSTLCLILHSCAIRPFLNLVYFYIVTDVFYAYNYLLQGIFVLIVASTSNMCATLLKGISLSVYGRMQFDTRAIGIASVIAAITAIILQYLFPASGKHNPADNKTVDISTVCSRQFTRKLFRHNVTRYIILYVLTFTVLQEVLAILRRDGIAVKLAKLLQLTNVTCCRIEKIEYVPVDRLYMGLARKQVQRLFTYINQVINYRSVKPVQVLGLVNTTYTTAKLSPETLNLNKFVQREEARIENTIALFLQLALLCILCVSAIQPSYNHIVGYAYVLVPLMAVLNTVYNITDMLLLYYVFSGIDLGGKKSVKDYPYTILEYETKNTIKIYCEYLVEPISRILGGLFAHMLRMLVYTEGATQFTNLPVLFAVLGSLTIIWLVLSVLQVYEVYTHTKSKINIFES